MHRPRYVHDTSASRRARAIYSTNHDEDSNNNHETHCDIRRRHRDDIKPEHPTAWDERSEDSGFGSDLDRRAAQLRISAHDNSRTDDVSEHVTKLDDVRASSRAKLTEEEKRRRTKARTLSTPDAARRWHRCDDVIEDYSDDDDVIEVDECVPRSKTPVSRSNSLPSTGQQNTKPITWDDVTLSYLRVLGLLGGGGYAKVFLVEIKRLNLFICVFLVYATAALVKYCIRYSSPILTDLQPELLWRPHSSILSAKQGWNVVDLTQSEIEPTTDTQP